MSRIVLDTNCLIQSIPYRSRYHKVWVSFIQGKNTFTILLRTIVITMY